MITLKFLRDYYRIPKKYKLLWAVIVEQSKDGEKKCRLGLILKDTDKVIDVRQRRFIQRDILIPVKRKVYPAKKHVDGDYVQFDTISDVCETVRLRRDTLEEEYFVSVYSPELMDAFLF